MKIFHVAAALFITTALGTSSARAQMLNGRYAGQGDGTDVNGTTLHQIAKWTFQQGKLVAFEEIISFPGSDSVAACEFTPSTPAPFPYSTGIPVTTPSS